MASKRPSTHQSPGELVFNGIDGSTGQYLLPAMSAAQLARVARGDKLEAAERRELESKIRRARQASFATIEGVDPNDLAQAGWAVVFVSAEPGSEAARRQQAVREALAPLLAHRRAQAARHKEHLYQEYTGERGYQPGETKQQFLARLGAGPGPVNPDKVPYYLLLVASPEELPFRIQYELDVQYAVGRLHFDTLEEYGRYARSVVEAETQAMARPRRIAFFGVANPDDRATQLSHAHLVMPVADTIEARHAQAGWTVERYLAEEATHTCLATLYGNAPALLFTASHGMGFPAGHEHQRSHQGALLCQDWPGPRGKLERGHYFAGEDLAPSADLRGMIGFHFACFGMGTPRRDDFARRALGKVQAREIATHDFVARLPQCMLAHPGGGALATIGHIDRAWGSAFLWIDARAERQTQRHVDVFESALTSLLAGKRVGYAMEYFNLRYAELAADLSSRIEELQDEPDAADERDESELAQMWIFHSDARNYAVLGDPAVRLASPGDARARAPEPGGPPPGGPPPGGPEHGRFASMAAPAGRNDWAAADSTQARGEPDMTQIRATAPMPEQTAFGWFGKDKDETGVVTRFASKVMETLGQVISDATTLEVKTYVSGDLQPAAPGKSEQPGQGAQLRAYTRCALDGDTEVYVPTKPNGEIDQALWTLHADMVKQAQQHRNEIIKIVLSLVSPLVKD